MTVSFFINRNDLQELYFLVDNFAIVPFDKATRDKAVIVECFNSIDTAALAASLISPSNASQFIQVNIEYIKFDKIREYLRF